MMNDKPIASSALRTTVLPRILLDGGILPFPPGYNAPRPLDRSIVHRPSAFD
ncbi:hypothetical protein ACHHV8_08205 [Paenibacillus sp. TAB 01]|uniref:hypothetical protein n=1 Tax=Paenibacillus sp. TAB 01 TaxID=3368988 RepID=UPI003751443A